ncbi:ABC transporter ATP-binding protein [Neobacillus notoginsengisoli]|uniref:ABC transporter ATP-binding protein n=1 Tax=Neobacillus notoginsengisoli TaxID=1578198 RepID=A0A417Z059_9BACI|nr:ABC transporter ATP-binding protein [Neobacillus notoginsengisoli]RHW43311.1 ABC transporter ATP-binding protein [Neobacillus notoginsengisoli]
MKFFKIDFQLIGLLLINLMISIVSILFPLSLMKITDYLIKGNLNKFYYFLSLAFVSIAIQMTLTYFGGKINNSYIKNRLISIREKIYNSLMKSDYATFKRKKKDEYLSLILTNTQLLENDYYKSLLNVITKAILLTTSLITLFILNSLITVSLLIIFGLISVFPLLFSNKIVKLQKEFISSTEEHTRSLAESLSGFEVIKVNRITKPLMEKYKAVIEEMEHTGMKLGNTIILANVVFGSSTMLLFLLIFLIGGYSVSQGTLTIGTLIATTQLLMYVIEPAISITQEINTIKSSKPIREKITEIVFSDKEEKYIDESFFPLKEDVCEIRLDKVCYKYPGENMNVLNNFSYSFKKGKKYAIIGGNGSGKSTLLKIIANLITDYSGNIHINSHDMKVVFIENIGYIDQYNFLFNASILDNLLLFNENKIRMREVEALFERKFFAPLLTTHNEGLNFIVGDNGENLSGGQKQKICIARALLKNPSILLLDEPNSALDVESSNQIEGILGELNDILCIMVTHKLDESLKEFDEILVLENGQLINHGSYEKVFLDKSLLVPVS